MRGRGEDERKNLSRKLKLPHIISLQKLATVEHWQVATRKKSVEMAEELQSQQTHCEIHSL